MLDIDLHSRVPIYEQLYRKMLEQIISGALKEDDQVPSVRSLAKELSVNPNTVSKAYQELDRNGITYTVPGKGCFVAKINREYIEDYILKDFDVSVEDALKSGLTKDKLKERIDGVNL